MTERLYYEDAYLRRFNARVAAVRKDGWVALDRSAFYPTSGGQPYDTGTLTRGEQAFRVLDVQVEDGVVWHRAEADLREGDRVCGEIDWERRWDHMQQHAADHMLAGAAWQALRAVTIGLHLGKETSSIDMALPDGRTRLTEEEISALEETVNRRAQRDDPIRCWFPDSEELAALPLRKKPTVAEHVRVVAMGDYEMVPCGGTHPGTTGQIGPVKILSCLPARGNARLIFVAGMRAMRYFQETARCAEKLCAALSASPAHAEEALLRERELSLSQRRALEERLLEAALLALEEHREGNLWAAHLPFAAPDTLLRAAGKLTKEPRAITLLSCPRGEGRHLVFARGADAAPDMAALLRSCGARGGGKPDMAQGAAPDGEALEKAARTLRAQAEERS